MKPFGGLNADEDVMAVIITEFIAIDIIDNIIMALILDWVDGRLVPNHNIKMATYKLTKRVKYAIRKTDEEKEIIIAGEQGNDYNSITLEIQPNSNRHQNDEQVCIYDLIIH